jgi:hypothetical protein
MLVEKPSNEQNLVALYSFKSEDTAPGHSAKVDGLLLSGPPCVFILCVKHGTALLCEISLLEVRQGSVSRHLIAQYCIDLGYLTQRLTL